MSRFSTLTTYWAIAVSMACVLVAWPLHMAQHAAESLGDDAVATLVTVLDQTDGDRTTDTASDTRQDGQHRGCVWCMFHGQQHVLGSVPEALRFHAESSPPPVESPHGRPAGRSELAAEPRGPPPA